MRLSAATWNITGLTMLETANDLSNREGKLRACTRGDVIPVSVLVARAAPKQTHH